MILVCGEALFDMFGTETETGFAFEARAAGSPFNVAVGLRRLGVDAALFTGVSTDFLGEKLISRLKEEGVDQSYLVRLDAPTTTAFVSLSEDGSATYAFYGRDAADRSLAPDATVDLTGVDALHFGSYSFVVGSTSDAYLALMRRAGGRFVSLDVNVRPNVEPDMDRWRDRALVASASCDLVKLSDEDAALLFPQTDFDDVAATILSRGARIVVVTKGPGGACAYTKTSRVAAPAVPVSVVDTVGAGDSFHAAFLAGLVGDGLIGAPGDLRDEAALRETLAGALAAAAMTCGRRGADLPTKLEWLWGLVEMRALALATD